MISFVPAVCTLLATEARKWDADAVIVVRPVCTLFSSENIVNIRARRYFQVPNARHEQLTATTPNFPRVVW